MAPSKGSVKGGATPLERPSDDDDDKPKESKHGIPYNSAGGGEVYSDGTIGSFLSSVRTFFVEERQRPSLQSTMVIGPDYHTRHPQWMEDKLVAINGSPLTDLERRDSTHWSNKYRKELDVAEAVQEVKRQRRYEVDHDVLGYVARMRRFLGLSMPLDEDYAVQHVRARHKLEEEARWLQANADAASGEARDTAGDAAAAPAATATNHGAAASPSPSLPPGHPVGVLPRGESPLLSELKKRPRPQDRPDKHKLGFFSAPWQALMESVETGKPLTKVVNEYRPRVDFYGLDAFLDATPSFVWFSMKCGIAIGLFQGTVKAVQAVNVDVQFLKASGVGVLSILNMSVFASVVKWGGNTTLFAIAFCMGDRLMKRIKQHTLPPHDAQHRSTANYVLGLSFSGAMVGVLPWWVLNDVGLALRMATSGLAVGGALGLMVGLSVDKLVALNTSRLDATNRQLRRYEALMHRQREWVEEERSKCTGSSYVWW
ncbi:putative mitochondrial hypothetical protein [Leptomonas pyrrhocoris]|uniref:Uncharacterized protein n=1 Tax=Leptomonas pyrrhocoris TaxID=157538 RepID=A0A0N1J4R4_LEPPY|nr:putative mitochondrial hypothetical protein [Leptomonas pyrrhocoris]KPA79258.1 putative mitochondrial hypothetical protein [Leptomonas pyrrhocoris]|eukprot:XP_015657697.1 putative mitochondrial hypothetical protein [Leptomonas pyrrhocoris]